MTVIGIVLYKGFMNITANVAENAMLADFAFDKLRKSGASGIYIADADSLNDILNNTEADSFLLLMADAIADDCDLASVFSCEQDVRFEGCDGEFLGAFITKPMEFCDMLKISCIRKVNGYRLTASVFADVLSKRNKSVYKELTKNNVYIEAGAVISPKVKIGEGSYIGAAVRISGDTVIGDNCVITGASYIYNSKIGRKTSVTSCVILDSVVGESVSAGPFAYIRPNSQVGDHVKVGDFVEIKNAVIGDGTKISHLTYVGDSDVGSGVNFGCGTVTVNYDGIHKNRTVIGDNVFIGCNTNLVAPVTVGDNAFIAAGSTVTDDIPALSFAIARQRQVTKENYVTDKMPDMVKKQKNTNKE